MKVFNWTSYRAGFEDGLAVARNMNSLEEVEKEIDKTVKDLQKTRNEIDRLIREGVDEDVIEEEVVNASYLEGWLEAFKLRKKELEKQTKK